MEKIGLIGVGHWGKNHLRALQSIRDDGEFDDLVVCDNNKELLDSIKKFNDVEVEINWKNLLRDKELSKVIIATSSSLHYQLAKDFMLAKKDVLVEKPMAMTSKECEDLINIRNETNSGLMVGHIFRFHPVVLELKKRIRKGDFGEIMKIKIFRQSIRRPRRDMGVMLALGIHDVDLTCFLLGDQPPDNIFADINFHYGNQEESALIIQKFGKTSCYSYESWIDPTNGKHRKLDLIGSKGCASFDFSIPDKFRTINSYLVKNRDQKSGFIDVINDGYFNVSLDYKEPLKEEIKHFIEESKNQKNYRSNAEVGKRAVEMIELAFEANNKRKVIDFPK